jgi:hypothetical protein
MTKKAIWKARAIMEAIQHFGLSEMLDTLN